MFKTQHLINNLFSFQYGNHPLICFINMTFYVKWFIEHLQHFQCWKSKHWPKRINNLDLKRIISLPSWQGLPAVPVSVSDCIFRAENISWVTLGESWITLILSSPVLKCDTTTVSCTRLDTNTHKIFMFQLWWSATLRISPQSIYFCCVLMEAVCN